LDNGFHNGDKWIVFPNDKEKVIEDVHRLPAPLFNGGPSVYPMRVKRMMEIKIRPCGSKEVIKEFAWSYTYQNFSGQNPKAPIQVMKGDPNVGIYEASGVKPPARIDKTKK
jgi:hypothetical protein